MLRWRLLCSLALLHGRFVACACAPESPRMLTKPHLSIRQILGISLALTAPCARALLPRTEIDDEYDFVIVGGGLAGLVLGGRLSEDTNHTVLVLESGGNGDDYRTRIGMAPLISNCREPLPPDDSHGVQIHPHTGISIHYGIRPSTGPSTPSPSLT